MSCNTCSHSSIVTQVLDCTFAISEGPDGLKEAVQRLCAEAQTAVESGGVAMICLSDRGYGLGRAPVPSLLATGAVHHHLVQLKLRSSVGLLVDSGEPREVHQFCLLVRMKNRDVWRRVVLVGMV